MIAIQSYFLILFLQVTTICIVAIAMIRIACRRAAIRHTIALTGIGLVLLSPLAVWQMPGRWLTTQVHQNELTTPIADVESTEIAAHSQSSTPPIARVSNGHQNLLNHELGTEPTSMPIPSSSETQVAKPIVESDILHSNFMQKQSRAWSLQAISGFCLFSIWIFGAVFSAIRLFVQKMHFHSDARPRKLSHAEQLSLSEITPALYTALDTDKLPAICSSQSVSAPVVVGILRPTVILPEFMIQNVEPKDLLNALIHECAHVVRHDHWIHVCQQFSDIVWWFHPAVKILNSELARSREEICDNYVLRFTKPADFARTLLMLTERCSVHPTSLSLLGLFFSNWNLELRVRELLDPERVKSTRTNFYTSIMIAVVLCSCSLAIGGISQATDNTSELSGSAKLSANMGLPNPDTKTQQESTGSSTKSSTKLSGQTLRLTLGGVCRLPDSDVPVRANLRVFISPQVYGEQPVLLAEKSTDDSGKFLFTDVEVQKTHNHQRIYILASAPAHASAMVVQNFDVDQVAINNIELNLSDQPTKLNGKITDSQDHPVEGATVFIPVGFGRSIPDFRCAITDEKGRFEILDLQKWDQDPNANVFSRRTLLVDHPNFPRFQSAYSTVPTTLDIQLPVPAAVEGRVVDLVTGSAVANVVVCAQGIVEGGYYNTRTDENGEYRLRMVEDHYNIWANQNERMPLAIEAFEALSGVRSTGIDIRMVRGGFVFGRVLDEQGEPVVVTDESFGNMVGHHGPARPLAGAAVTSAQVNKDGTYRLHVAPGKNYIYYMPEQTAKGVVDVGDGEEVELDLKFGQSNANEFASAPGRVLREKLYRAAYDETQKIDEDRSSSEPNAAQDGSVRENQPATSRIRRDSKTNQLLNSLEDFNRSDSLRLTEPWAALIREIVQLGPDAVPDLIVELDATNDEAMLRSLGFILRAMDDKRAIPALIRAIPKTLQPSSSDYGLRVEKDSDLLKFMQANDLDERNSDLTYSYGRPIREILGALESLSSQTINDHGLYHVAKEGFATQLYAKQVLFHKFAERWRDWWLESGSDLVMDEKYKKVNLKPLPISNAKQPELDKPLITVGGGSNHIVCSIHDSPSIQNGNHFYDLDTGRSAKLPQRWGRKLTDDDVAAILAWAANEGYDIMGADFKNSNGQTVHAIRTIGIQAWQLNDARWKSLPNEFTVEELKSEGTPVRGEWLLYRDRKSRETAAEKHAPFLYITSAGTPGVIYVGVSVTEVSQQSGGILMGDVDSELQPVGFWSTGRRFGFATLQPK